MQTEKEKEMFPGLGTPSNTHPHLSTLICINQAGSVFISHVIAPRPQHISGILALTPNKKHQQRYGREPHRGKIKTLAASLELCKA